MARPANGRARYAPNNPASRGADRLCLSLRDQHQAGQAGARVPFKGTVGKDVVSRVWRKLKTDWEGWMRRDLASEHVVRLSSRHE
jgi:hypothetical protein